MVMRVVALPLAAGGISLLPQWMLLAQRGDGKKNNKKGEEENIMLKIEHLTKSYGEKKAVDDLSLHIAPGEIYGFIGHNEAAQQSAQGGARPVFRCRLAPNRQLSENG